MAKPISVAQLNSYMKRIVSMDPILGNISVIGEISNLKYHSTGVYFSLKDASSKVSCYIPPSVSRSLKIKLEEGKEVIAHGYINIYERGGSYSINIRDLEVQGLGGLAEAFEKLKEKLEKEGLFNQALKKKLPGFPKKVAVVTSPTGAAVEDIKKIILSRNNYVDILICPVLVQGPNAAGTIARAIERLNLEEKDVDVMIVGRGGGSMEELWAFNEEVVARAIAASEIPVISAVGHETDFTIADFVADVRAETPTAAAALAVPDLGELRAYLNELCLKLDGDLELGIRRRENRLAALDIESLKKRMEDRLTIGRLKADNMYHTLENLNPASIMGRGYSIMTDEKGKLLNSTKALHEGDVIINVLGDGKVLSKVTEVKANE